MTIERILLTLALLAGSLLIAALSLMGSGLGLGGAGANLEGIGAGTAQLSDWTADTLKGVSSNGATGLSGMMGTLDTRVTLAGIAVGWTLRWVYSLPWGAMPRAVVVWMLGWRNSVAMLGLAVGCIAVILLV